MITQGFLKVAKTNTGTKVKCDPLSLLFIKQDKF